MRYALWRDRLVLLIVALLPWQARYVKEPAALYGVPWEQGTASLFVLELLVLAALCCHLMAGVTRCEPKKAGAPVWLQISALLPFYAFISIFWAYDTIGAFFSAIHLFEGYAVAYLIWVSGVRLTSALAAFVTGTAATSALGLWQFLSQASFDSTWLGVSAHPASVAGTAVIETGSGRFLRAYGSLPHPNVLGGYAAAGLTAALALAAAAKRRRILLTAAIVTLAAGLVASFSRSAWLAAFFAVATGLLFPRAAATKEARARLALPLLAAAAGIAFIGAYALPSVATRLSAQGRLETKSVTERVSSISEGYELFRRYVSTGTGIGNYLPTTYLEFGYPDDPYALQPPHFVPLLVAAELGFFGLAILVGIVGAWWFAALWLLRRAASPTVALAAVLPVVILVVACFDHYPFDLFAGTMLTGALFGLFLKAGEESSG